MKSLGRMIWGFWALSFLASIVHAQPQRVIALTWQDVVGQTRQQNLSLKIEHQNYRFQRLEERKALTAFLPQFSYQGVGTRNIELPEFVFRINNVEQRFRVGTTYNISHSLQVSFPLFLGGSRLANFRSQRYLKKSIAEELKGKEASVVLQALQNYFSVLLSQSLIEVNRQAKEAAAENLRLVEKFFEVGTASRLDLLRARSRYSATLPVLLAAQHQKLLAVENLKFLLNIPQSDSVVVLDSLRAIDFLKDFRGVELARLKEIALKERPELKMTESSAKAVAQQTWLAGSQFLPSIYLSGSVDHQAQVETLYPASRDFTRSKRASLTVQFPLFQGAKRLFNFQQARIQSKKMELQLELLKQQLSLEVEQAFYKFRETLEKLQSLKQAAAEAKESRRLAELYFQRGMATQLEVLNAQLGFTQSQINYQQGLYDYDVSQLQILQAIGRLDTIWESD